MTLLTNSAEGFSWTGRRVAITGATGFVGLQVAAQLRAAGADVVALHRAGSNTTRLTRLGVRPQVAPLTDTTALAVGCRGAEILIHAAAAVDFRGDWELARRVNVEGTRAVIHAARSAGVRRMVHISSIVAVGASRWPEVLDETAGWTLGSFRVSYATTKREAEREALQANRAGLEVVVVNPGCVVGPDDFGGSEFGTLCKRYWRGRVPIHFTGGNAFVDVRDAAAGVLAAALRGRPGERYVLTSENRRWAAFFQDLSRAACRTIPRLTLPDWLAPPLARVLSWTDRKKRRAPSLTTEQAKLVGLYFYFSSAKARRELGFSPRPLRDSLADAYAFWRGERRAA